MLRCPIRQFRLGKMILLTIPRQPVVQHLTKKVNLKLPDARQRLIILAAMRLKIVLYETCL